MLRLRHDVLEAPGITRFLYRSPDAGRTNAKYWMIRPKRDFLPFEHAPPLHAYRGICSTASFVSAPDTAELCGEYRRGSGGGYLPHMAVVDEYLWVYIESCIDALFQGDTASA